mmetsp:Transcript_65334/g.202227  ORF Transcript_65334/g.202227 Transcript_65334/m.202227 type:complete len:91 (-) Transcript_65334:66-338(-)
MCGDGTCNQFVSCICAYFIPPLGIFFRFGCGTEFCICLVLTILGYVPGVIYAIVMIGCENPAEGREAGDVCGEPTKVSPESAEGYITLPK